MYVQILDILLFIQGWYRKKAQAHTCTCIQITAKNLYSKGFQSRVIVLQNLALNSPNAPAWMFLSFTASHSALFFRTIISKLLAEITVDLIKCTR